LSTKISNFEDMEEYEKNELFY